VPLNGDDVEILQDLGPANGDQVTPNTIDTAATGEQRLVAGPHISNVEEGKTRGVYVVAFYFLDTSLISVLAAT
jgi:hypothetical protein